jgi:pyridoxal phosphate enzyme (YggS family)
MAKAQAEAGRADETIALVVVTKGRSHEQIMAVYEEGHRDFGENRAQELAAKAPDLPGDIRWHFIGPLQRNKVNLVRPLVVKLHSLDRMKLARAWVDGTDAAPPALLEVNLGAEPQKHGFPAGEVVEAARSMIELGVDLRGVMAIPPQGEPAFPHFSRLVQLRDVLAEHHPAIREVSAGMTDDYEEAIRAGATTIRVGRAIFD